MALRDFTINQIEDFCKNSTSFSDLARKLGYSSRGSVLYVIQNFLIENNISYTHFTYRNDISKRKRISIEDVFIENSKVSQKTLRNWYKKGSYTPYVCALCGQEPFWKGKSLTLRLDHINGYNKDNRLDNLRWICPNCDSQLDTYNGRNKNHKHRVIREKSKCIDCGTDISLGAIRCRTCANKVKIQILLEKQKEEGLCLKKTIIRDELKTLIRELPMTKVGEFYGMTDNSVRKWCEKFGLPKKVSDIRQISDEDWEKI